MQIIFYFILDSKGDSAAVDCSKDFILKRFGGVFLDCQNMKDGIVQILYQIFFQVAVNLYLFCEILL